MPTFPSESYQIETACGNLYIHILYKSEDRSSDNIFEVLCNLGKTGVCAMAHISAEAKMISSLINKIPKGTLIEVLNRASGHKCGSNTSCSDQLTRFIIDLLTTDSKNIAIDQIYSQDEEEEELDA